MSKKVLLTTIMLLFGMMAAWAGPVTLVQPEHGTMSISPTAPAPGDHVTLTITPDAGWVIQPQNIKIEVTLNPGSAQGPRRVVLPRVGETVTFSEGTEPNTFLFEMPQEPFGVKITATLTEQTGLRGDINGDGVVDSFDVNTIVNMSLGKATKLQVADLNGDGEVDGLDVNIEINIVLGKN